MSQSISERNPEPTPESSPASEYERQLVARCVTPLCPRLMDLKADGSALAPDVAALARTVDVEDILILLTGAWRPRVMGAWLSLTVSDDRLAPAVLESLRTADGPHSAPSLIAAALILAGSDAQPAIYRYAVTDSREGYGSVGLAAAAIAYLSEEADWRISYRDQRSLAGLLAFGHSVHEASLQPV